MDAVARTTGAVARRVATLNNKAGLVAVEREAIVEALLGQLAKVRHMDRGALAVKAHHDGALAGVKDRDLVTLHLIRRRVERLRTKETHVPSKMSSSQRHVDVERIAAIFHPYDSTSKRRPARNRQTQHAPTAYCSVGFHAS
jgi:hypothetical protein